jgi:hypothetical protein
VSDQAGSLADRATSAAKDVGHKAGQAPQAVRRGTEGNPLAAGLIAFGAGWLASTLIPASRQERQLAGEATDWAREHSQVATDQVGQVAEQLKEPAKQAIESVRSSAADAANTVTDEARGAAGDVTDRAQEAKDSVQENR